MRSVSRFLQNRVEHILVDHDKLSRKLATHREHERAASTSHGLTSEEALQRLIEGSLSTRLAWP